MQEEEFQRTRFNFLLADACIGLTIAKIAFTIPMDAEKHSRSVLAARTAYDTISQFRLDLILNELQESELNELMARLREHLVRLGERF